MNRPEISILVPVYNAKEYLARCVDSIAAQTLPSWELLLIDDGSTDGSGALCDACAGRDGRIRVIHQENAGVSAARNTGLAAARGRYVGFVDADDWIEPGMFQALYCAAERSRCGAAMCDAVTVDSHGRTEPDTIRQLAASCVLAKADFTPALLREMAGSVCRCLYRAALLEAHAIRFPRGIKFSEDRVFNLLAFGYADRVVYCKAAYYNRFVRAESVVHRFHTDYFAACLAASEQIREAIRLAWGDEGAYQRAYLSQLIAGAYGAVCNYYYQTSPLTGAERRAVVKALCRNEALRTAIVRADDRSLRARLLLHGNAAALALYARLANWKHGR